ncbi:MULTISPECIES: hypothetical protein [unclassified Streptomyces]|uniref:hypothetical protein n=1 Tax=unclassified Streptomyces TaxID=2593676 RepID=UPI00344CC59A
MIEILDDLDVLLQPYIDLTTVGMGGTALGAPATDVPRRSIVQAQSSLVARYRGGTATGSEYFDAEGRRLTLDEVVDHAVRSDGFLYCADELTYKVRGGTVVGFALHGPHLSHFAHLTSYEELLTAFGRPDRVRENKTHGELMSYGVHYWGSRKQVWWDAWDHRVSLINMGEFEGSTGP